MVVNQILQWLRNDYAPLTYAQPDDTILQNIANVVRYWNTHSSFPILQMISTPTTSAQLDPHYKNVVNVLPAQQPYINALADPTWVLLGTQVMNYLSADLIAINEGYKNYLSYFTGGFQFNFVPSNDPTIGGTLFIQNSPTCQGGRLAVIGTMRILPADDIVAEPVLEWILAACKAQTQMIEGNLLRKADIINVKNDGQVMITESKQDWSDLKERLETEGRWSCLAKVI